MSHLKYLDHYPVQLKAQVEALINSNKLAEYLLKKYPQPHNVSNDRALRDFVFTLKNQYMKQSAPLSQVVYDNRLHVVHNALGIHRYVNRVQGIKIKSKNEIKISAFFKRAPVDFLQMIVVHELAHLKEKDHNKSFYQLCTHMLPNYHQLEFDTRTYLLQLELNGPIYG